MSCSSIITGTFSCLIIVILPKVLYGQGTTRIDTLSNLTIEDTRTLFRGILDMRRLSHSVAVGRIAKDQRLADYVEGFMERNDVDVFTIAYIDSDRFWPNVFKNWSLKKLAQQPQEKLLTAKARFIPTLSGGKVVGYSVDLELEGRSNQVFELLQLENTTLEAIAGAVNANQMNSDFSDPVSARETVVDALINSLQKIEEHGDMNLAVEGNEHVESSDSIENDPATNLIHTDSIVAHNIIVTGLTRNPYLVAINTISDSVNVGQQRIQMTYSIADTLGLQNVKLEVVQISDNDTLDVVAYFDLPIGQKIDFTDSDGKIGWSGLDADGKPIGTGKYLFRLTASTDKNFENGFEDYEELVLEDISQPEFPVTTHQLTKIFPNTDSSRIKEVVHVLNQFSTDYGLTTKERMAHFLGQIGTETNGLKKLRESANYSAKNIYSIFLKVKRKKKGGVDKTHKYCDLIKGYDCESLYSCLGNNRGPKHCKKEPQYDFPRNKEGNPAYNQWVKKGNSIKTSYVRNTSLFDYVYSCRMDNGAKSTGDGSKYLGKGFIHMTGKDKYKRVSEAWNKKYPDDKREFHKEDIDELETNVEVAMKASLLLWEMDNLNNYADKGLEEADIDKVGAKVNGSGTRLPNGYKKRRDYTNLANAVFSKI